MAILPALTVSEQPEATSTRPAELGFMIGYEAWGVAALATVMAEAVMGPRIVTPDPGAVYEGAS